MRGRHRDLPALLFLLPAGLLLFAFWVFPTVLLFVMSWLEWGISGFSSASPTAANYQAVFSDPEFWRAALNTAYLTLGTVPLSVALALLLALLVVGRARSSGFFQVAIFSPTITSLVASGIIWVWLMDYDLGLVNHALEHLF